jgi:hypothetical protein
MSTENDERKAKLEFRTSRVQHALALLALVHVTAFVVGALLGFVYLVRHQFNPGGISGSDTLAMILWALGFLLTLVIGLSLATVAGFPLARLIDLVCQVCRRGLLWIKRKDLFPHSGFWWALRFGTPNQLEWHPRQGSIMFCGCVILAMFCWLIAVVPFELGMFFVTLLATGIFVSMIVFGTMVESFSPVPKRIKKSAFDVRMNRLSIGKRGIVITLSIVAATTFLCFGTWLDASAVLIGFREQNVNVRLAKEDFEDMLEQATRAGFAVNPCEQLTTGASTLKHVDILWQNLGSRSLLRFPSQPFWNSTSASREIRFKTGNAAIASVVSAKVHGRCGEMLAAALFRDSDKRPRANAGARILEQLPWLGSLSPGAKIQIVVFTGKSSATSDAAMAETLQQAIAVKRLVEVLAKLPATAVEAVGAGYSIAKRECDNHSGGQRMLCDAIGRRIEIRILDTD